MTVKSFLKFVEIQTEIAGVVPFALGTAYAIFRFGSFDLLNAVLMFLALFLFGMTTTAINNYVDFKTAVKKEGYNYEQHNAMGKYKISPKTALVTICTMLFFAVVFGFILFLRTDIVVLALGVLSFGVGILYSYGPIPISHTPFGELFAGAMQGFVLPFLAIYIHVYNEGLVSTVFASGQLNVTLDMKELIYLFLFTLPIVMSVANIMLANNICDMQDDLVNGRKTLPLWMGEKKSLYAFVLFYVVGYIGILMGIILQVLPLVYGLGLLSSVFVFKNVRIFLQRQVKSETFVLAVKNFTSINVFNLFLLCVSIGLA